MKCNNCGGEMEFKENEGILIPIGEEMKDTKELNEKANKLKKEIKEFQEKSEQTIKRAKILFGEKSCISERQETINKVLKVIEEWERTNFESIETRIYAMDILKIKIKGLK